jgi:23S rRNA (uracil1939-C5)-methyltransferase
MKLSIEKIVYGGDGLARTDDDRTVFVPFTLPGEVVEVTAVRSGKGAAEANVERLLHSSPDRVSPRCIHFGSCGGCQLQHANYEAQLEIKREVLLESLQRAGLPYSPPITTHATEAWEYRNRIRVRIAKDGKEFRAGYLRRASNEFLPISMCPIAAPLLWTALEAVLASAEHEVLEKTQELELFTDAEQSKLQLRFFVSRKVSSDMFLRLCTKLQQRVPEMAGAGTMVMEHAGKNRQATRFRTDLSWGTDGLRYLVGEESYWVSRGGFFQVNRLLLDRFVQLVTEGRQGALAWDLYAGVGLFSRVLAKNFTEVVAVEADAGDLIASFRGKGRRAVAATTAEFLRQAILERDQPDLVVLDPPRAGLGDEVCHLLSRSRTPEIVYVSCDPITLGRDLKQMVDSGYRLMELHLVDMFPQTFHQETVAILRHVAL